MCSDKKGQISSVLFFSASSLVEMINESPNARQDVTPLQAVLQRNPSE